MARWDASEEALEREEAHEREREWEKLRERPRWRSYLSLMRRGGTSALGRSILLMLWSMSRCVEQLELCSDADLLVLNKALSTLPDLSQTT